MFDMTKRVARDAISAVERTPVEVLLAVGAAAFLSVALETPALDGFAVARVVMPMMLLWFVILAISALASLRVFPQPTRWILTAVATAGSAAYGLAVFEPEQIGELWRYAFLVTSAITGLMLVPVAARMKDATASERFWRFNMLLGFRFGIAFLYAGLLYVGLAVAVQAISKLFEIELSGEIYGHLAAWIFVGGGGLLAAGGLSDVVRIDRALDEASLKWLGRLGTFLFIPLLLLYLGILYAYFIKMFATGAVPSNMISPLALGAGMLGFLGLFVLQPFMHRDDHRSLALVLQAFPAAFVPIVPLGAWAVLERIDQYGFTEFRYARLAALVCLGGFALIGAYRWVRRQPFSLTTGPAILAVVSLLAAAGPWSATSVATRSQTGRLIDAAASAGVLTPERRLAAPEMLGEVTGEAGSTLSATVKYLVEHHGARSLRHILPTDVEVSNDAKPWEVAEALLLQPNPQFPTDRDGIRNTTFAVERNEPRHLTRGGTLHRINIARGTHPNFGALKLGLDANALSVQRDDERLRIDLSRFTADLPRAEPYISLAPEEAFLPLLRGGQRVGELHMESVGVEKAEDHWRVHYLDGYLLIY